MTHINDARQEKLEAAGYSSESEWLKVRVGWEAGDAEQINDLWGLLFELLGYSGAASDMAYQWLGDTGHTGAIADRWLSYWSSADPLP